MTSPRRGQPVTLNTLRDVDPTGLGDGDAPIWDAATQRYKPGSVIPTANTLTWQYQDFAVGTPAASVFTLNYIPHGINNVSLNGIVQRQGTDYTVNFSTGVITFATTPTAGDIVTVSYVTTGATGPASPLWLDYEGTENTSGTWAMSSMTIGARVSGTWTYHAATPGQAFALGLADAYSVETTVSTRPGGSSQFYDWFAGWGNSTGHTGSRQTGVDLQTDNTSLSFYLIHNGTVVLTNHVASTVPTVGQTVKVVVDFTAGTATATINGSVVATLTIGGETWYTADGASA